MYDGTFLPRSYSSSDEVQLLLEQLLLLPLELVEREVDALE
jgi:hypothetical protein